MTYNPVDASTVRTDSKILGWSKSLARSKPREVSSTTTGGGVVDNNDRGQQVEPGTTSGDTAFLEGHRALNDYDKFRGLYVFELVFRIDAGVPYSDEFEIGLLGDTVNNGASAHLDLTTEEFAVDTTTVALDRSPGTEEVLALRIEADALAGETRFILADSGGVQRKTISSLTGGGYKSLVGANSNGNGESLTAMMAAQHYVPAEAYY